MHGKIKGIVTTLTKILKMSSLACGEKQQSEQQIDQQYTTIIGEQPVW